VLFVLTPAAIHKSPHQEQGMYELNGKMQEIVSEVIHEMNTINK
jgi:hypothetical protein